MPIKSINSSQVELKNAKAPLGYKVWLCSLGQNSSGQTIYGYKCVEEGGNCTRLILKCTSFGKSSANDFSIPVGTKTINNKAGDIALSKAIVVNNYSQFYNLFIQGVMAHPDSLIKNLSE